jgi:hypothetical protein
MKSTLEVTSQVPHLPFSIKKIETNGNALIAKTASKMMTRHNAS